jgi:hypothetical protein
VIQWRKIIFQEYIDVSIFMVLTMFYYKQNDSEYLTDHLENDNQGYFSSCREGDIDPAHGKRINVLIENGADFIVYLDQDLNIRYAVSMDYGKMSEFYGRVLNKAARLEGLADTSFMNKKQIKEYRSMLGSAIARMYEHESEETIFENLQKAELFLTNRVTETARIWYLSSASVSLFLLTASFLFILFYKSELLVASWIHYPLSIYTGGLGAYLSIIMNSKKIAVNPSSGRIIHFLESNTRLIIGMIGGLFITILISSKIFNPEIHGNSIMTFIIFSFAAGFSERMVPNFINQIERTISTDKKKEAFKNKMEQ